MLKELSNYYASSQGKVRKAPILNVAYSVNYLVLVHTYHNTWCSAQ
jgi:hypothetical protein